MAVTGDTTVIADVYVRLTKCLNLFKKIIQSMIVVMLPSEQQSVFQIILRQWCHSQGITQTFPMQTIM